MLNNYLSTQLSCVTDYRHGQFPVEHLRHGISRVRINEMAKPWDKSILAITRLISCLLFSKLCTKLTLCQNHAFSLSLPVYLQNCHLAINVTKKLHFISENCHRIKADMYLSTENQAICQWHAPVHVLREELFHRCRRIFSPLAEHHKKKKKRKQKRNTHWDTAFRFIAMVVKDKLIYW